MKPLLLSSDSPGRVPGRNGDRADSTEHTGALNRTAVHPGPVTEVPPIVHDVLRSPGDPLPTATRAVMEPKFGRDFSRVRIHTGAAAAASARVVHAQAYTVGEDIVFAQGTYAPDSACGRRLLAHELAHTVQQQGVGNTTSGVSAGLSQDAAEREATEAAEGTDAARPVIRLARPAIMCQTQGVSTREARGIAGELGMGFAYRAEEGWGFLTGPGGSAGHRWNAPGFDGVAFRTQGPFEIHIVDNKSWARAGNVGSASALTDNLLKNLDDLISVAGSAQYDDVPRIAQVRTSLSTARAAVAGKATLPAEVQLVVTSHGGRSTGVTASLTARGVRFAGAAGPVPASGTTAAPPAPSDIGPHSGTAAMHGEGTAAMPVTVSAAVRGAGRSSPAVAQVTSAEARAIAAEAGKALRSELRLLRGARILSTALQVMNAIGALHMLDEFMEMARSGLEGKGFILTNEIAESRRLEQEVGELRRDYQSFSESVTALQYQFLKLGPDPVLAARTLIDIMAVRNRIVSAQSEIPKRLTHIREVLREVEAKEKAATNILESPSAMATIGAVTFGSAQLAEIFAASQDLQRIRSHLRPSVTDLEALQTAMQEDIDFLDAWWGALFEICLRTGLSTELTVSVPLIGDIALNPAGGRR